MVLFELLFWGFLLPGGLFVLSVTFFATALWGFGVGVRESLRGDFKNWKVFPIGLILIALSMLALIYPYNVLVTILSSNH